MCVVTYDKDFITYCFGRKIDGVFEILLAKTMRDRDKTKFNQEVENLTKYFNVNILVC